MAPNDKRYMKHLVVYAGFIAHEKLSIWGEAGAVLLEVTLKALRHLYSLNDDARMTSKTFFSADSTFKSSKTRQKGIL